MDLVNVNFVELEGEHLCNLTKNELHYVHFIDDV